MTGGRRRSNAWGSKGWRRGQLTAGTGLALMPRQSDQASLPHLRGARVPDAVPLPPLGNSQAPLAPKLAPAKPCATPSPPSLPAARLFPYGIGSKLTTIPSPCCPGEYHTMVLASRLFARPLALGATAPQREGDYAYLAHTTPPQAQAQ